MSLLLCLQTQHACCVTGCLASCSAAAHHWTRGGGVWDLWDGNKRLLAPPLAPAGAAAAAAGPGTEVCADAWLIAEITLIQQGCDVRLQRQQGSLPHMQFSFTF